MNYLFHRLISSNIYLEMTYSLYYDIYKLKIMIKVKLNSACFVHTILVSYTLKWVGLFWEVNEDKTESGKTSCIKCYHNIKILHLISMCISSYQFKNLSKNQIKYQLKRFCGFENVDNHAFLQKYRFSGLGLWLGLGLHVGSYLELRPAIVQLFL